MLDQLTDGLNKLIKGLERAMEVCAETAPLLLRQEILTRARRRLDTSYEEYRGALDIHFEGDTVLVCELDPESWLANAVEQGADPWNMKEQFLRSPRARRSKRGFRYMRLAIPKDKQGGHASDRPESIDLQQKIRQALERPTFGPTKVRPGPDGTVGVTEKVTSGQVGGLYRVRRFANMEEFKGRGPARATQYVLLRTVSDNPLARGKWDHPGIKAARIFPEVERWAESILPDILEKMIDDTVQKYVDS